MGEGAGEGLRDINPGFMEAIARIASATTHNLSSASSAFMAEKLALPTPTMMMDMGSLDALMMAILVSAMSLRTPSVRSSRTKYCCKQ